jgi:hypothetical protein
MEALRRRRCGGREDSEEVGQKASQGRERPEGNPDADRRQEAEGNDREEAGGKAAAQIGLDAARVTAVTSVIEGWIREYSDQWLWLHRR